MWRVAISKKDNTIESMNFPTKEECENWVLKKLEEEKNISSSIIMNKDNKSERFLEKWI